LWALPQHLWGLMKTIPAYYNYIRYKAWIDIFFHKHFWSEQGLFRTLFRLWNKSGNVFFSHSFWF
jgi:hypothetical protein